MQFVTNLITRFRTRKANELRRRNAELYHRAARPRHTRRVATMRRLVASGAYDTDAAMDLAMPRVGAGLARDMAAAHAEEEREAHRAHASAGVLPADDDAARAMWDRDNVGERFEVL